MMQQKLIELSLHADSVIWFNPSLSWALENLYLRITGCIGIGTGMELRHKYFAVSRVSDEPYVFHSLATSFHITLVHFYTEPLSSGSGVLLNWRDKFPQWTTEFSQGSYDYKGNQTLITSFLGDAVQFGG
jgi:hypothetical protein